MREAAIDFHFEREISKLQNAPIAKDNNNEWIGTTYMTTTTTTTTNNVNMSAVYISC